MEPGDRSHSGRRRAAVLRVLLLTMAWVAALAIIPAASRVSACVGEPLVPEGEAPPEEVVFTGTAVKVVDPRMPFDPVMSSADLMEWTFVVDGVVSGPAQQRVVIRSERMDASCGFMFELGQRYHVVAADRGEGLHVASAGGTRLLQPLANPPPIEESALGSLSIPLIVTAIALIGLVSVLAFRSNLDRRTNRGES